MLCVDFCRGFCVVDVGNLRIVDRLTTTLQSASDVYAPPEVLSKHNLPALVAVNGEFDTRPSVPRTNASARRWIDAQLVCDGRQCDAATW